MLYGVSNSSNTTGSTYNLVFMQRSISLYRALKNTRFSSTSPTRIFGDFWYVIEDMFLNQKPLKNLLLQLVAGWPTFCDKMPGLIGVELLGFPLDKVVDSRKEVKIKKTKEEEGKRGWVLLWHLDLCYKVSYYCGVGVSVHCWSCTP